MGDCPHPRTPREGLNGDMGSGNAIIKAVLDADSAKTAISVPEKEQPRKPGSEVPAKIITALYEGNKIPFSSLDLTSRTHRTSIAT